MEAVNLILIKFSIVGGFILGLVIGYLSIITVYVIRRLCIGGDID